VLAVAIVTSGFVAPSGTPDSGRPLSAGLLAMPAGIVVVSQHPHLKPQRRHGCEKILRIHPTSSARAFSSEVETGSREENASKQEIEPRSDFIGTEKALVYHGRADPPFSPNTLKYNDGKRMQALFIGQTYIDVTFITDHMPTGDEKHVASAYAVSFGGNAVTAAFCCAKLGIVPDLIATVANDWLGRMFWDMSAKYGISVHPRKVNASSLSFIMPNDGKRAIVRCRDDEHIHPFPILNIKGCRALHIDGHQPDAAIHYAKLCREAGILTSLDGGGLRSNTHELLEFIDVAIVAERLCEQMEKTPEEMLDYLKSRGCRVGGVTMGEKGLLWYDETGTVRNLPALPIPRERVIDTNGAGDVFHGAYVYSYLSNPGKSWQEHFIFARAASTYKIQRLGNEAGLPTLQDIEVVKMAFAAKA
jgi:sugar/nucleoside kinase (ribokinase family)